VTSSRSRFLTAFRSYLVGFTTLAGPLACPPAHAAPPDARPACLQPILVAGQEAAIEKMVTPTKLPPGVQQGDVQVLRDRVRALFTLQGNPSNPAGVRLDYELAPWTTGTDPLAMRTSRLAIRRVAPCPQPGVQCPVDKALLQAMDTALTQTVLVGEDAVQWRCLDADQPPEGLGALMRKIDDQLRVADMAGAQQTLDVALRAFPADQQPLAARLDLGVSLWRADRKTGARQVLRDALALFDVDRDLQPVPLQADTRALAERVAAARALLGEPEAARRVMAACQERAARNPCDVIPLADALALAGEPTQAAAVLDSELARPNPTAILFRARIGLASRQNDAKAEVPTAEAAVRAFPDDLALQEALATAYFRGMQHTRAIRTLEAILRKDPKYPNVLGRIAGVFNDMGSAGGNKPMPGWHELREEMRARALRDPHDTVALFLSAVATFYDAHFTEALAILQRVEPLAPREGRVFIYEAMANLWLGHRDEAERLVRKAMETNPYDPDVYYCLSQVVRQRDIPAAITALERYVALSSTPGALEFPKKTERVRQELAMLRQGKLPPLWDRPGQFSDAALEPTHAAPTAWHRQVLVGLGLGLLALALGLWRWRRRKP
jgi:tetratricopeptide (TPR) repeat protein